MKALKTIVATAMIALAFTTVAVAGARHVGNWDGAAVPTAGPVAPQNHQGAGVTLTDHQFARLLHAVNGQSAKLHTRHADRDMSRDRDRDHSRLSASDAMMHLQAQQRTRTHDGGRTHERGTKRGGTHLGGDTHHDGGTHHE